MSHWLGGLMTVPYIDQDTGKLLYIRHKQAYFEAKQILSLNPLRFSQSAKSLDAKPQFAKSVIGLKRQPVFSEKGNYLGRLGDWQFDQQGLFLTNIVIVDTSIWRKLMGKMNPDFVVSRSQIRLLAKRKIIVISEGQIVEQDRAPYPIA